jgi:predicted flap endonuclease-1-like 5' DNA nuclease
MRFFLIFLLVVVAGVLGWAVSTETFNKPSVFILSVIVATLSGYLIAETFFSKRRKDYQNNLEIYKKDVISLKEQNDILQKQASLSTPESEVSEMRVQLQATTLQKNKLDADFLQQATTITSLNVKFETLRKEYDRLRDNANINAASVSAESNALRDSLEQAQTDLSIAKNYIGELERQNQLFAEKLADSAAQAHLVAGEAQEEEVRFLADEDTEENTLLAQTPDDSVPHRLLSAYDEEETAPLDNNAADLATFNFMASPDDIGDTIETKTNERQHEAVSDSSTKQETPTAKTKLGKADDLKVIEGIGPKIEGILKAAGIANWQELSEVSVENLKATMKAAGTQYNTTDPSSWVQQALLLAQGEFEKFKDLTALLGSRKK